MTDPPRPSDAAERHASELLALIATQPPVLRQEFTGDVIRVVRIQRAVAAPLHAAGNFLAAIFGALGGVVAAELRRSKP